MEPTTAQQQPEAPAKPEIVFSTNPELKPMLITNEAQRQYVFPGGNAVFIEEPVALHVSRPSGGHRILDAKGFAHYIPPGWFHLFWKPKPGAEAFSF